MGARLTEKKVGRGTWRGAGHCDRMYDGGLGYGCNDVFCNDVFCNDVFSAA